jgi:ankyrin repeat protein
VNKKGISGMAPLHVLSREEHDFDTVCKIAAMLLEAGADPNQLDEHGDAPLSNAVCYGNLEYVKLLIHNGADVNERDKFGTLPIIRAECSPQNNMGNNTIVVSVLVEAGADTQEQSIISDKVASCSKCGLRVKRGYPCAYCAHWAMMYDQHNSF